MEVASYRIKTTDMISNKVKRNIFLALSIIGIAVTAARIFDLAMGEGEWWQPVSSAAIFACCFKFYLVTVIAVVDFSLTTIFLASAFM